MIIIPAVDLKDGKCVRLAQGRMDQETVYSENPVEMAKHWESKGAERLHVVDLNGAAAGKPIHRSLIMEIVYTLRIPVEIGGGIRDLDTIEGYLHAGAGWVILGTAALRNQDLLKEACRRFPGRVILGIDARRGKVAVEGWKEADSVEVVELAKRFEGIGLSAIIFTDIEKDGMRTGLNFESTRNVSRSTSIPVIASGGVSRIEDIEQIMELESDGVIGVITGRALYAGSLDLEEAIRIARRKSETNSKF
jgi:phosphoribosylformimino-5-aminoimidazole carboxamide ribotide isomerase